MRTLTLAMAVVLLAGCAADEGEGAPFIAATIDGMNWHGTAQEGEPAYVVGGGSYIWVISSKKHLGAWQYLVLDLPNPPTIGSWSLGGDSADASFLSCPNDVLADCISWEAIAGDPGTLEIISVDSETGRMTGTFSFPGYALGDSTGAVKSIRGGTFDIRAPGVFVLE